MTTLNPVHFRGCAESRWRRAGALGFALVIAAHSLWADPIPQPVTGHPRLWLTAADLPRLRGWAAPTNPIYQQGLVPLLATAVSHYTTQCFPGGVQNPAYPDFGDTQGYSGVITEQDAIIFALHSLIDPDPAARIVHARRARNLIMVAMNEAAKGARASAPFRDPAFSVYNRANAGSECWPLVVDWIYNTVDASGNPVLTAQDKATIRTVFLRWATECLNASTTGGDHPEPVGTTNSLALLPNGDAYRMAVNNYYLGHARLVTLMSLAIDPVDDPAVNPALPLSTTGNSLRSYIANATGAWLYQEYAMLGEPAAVRAAYGLSSTAAVGLASGGLPAEGMLYGHSYSFLLGQLLALKTAGFADPALSGPQVALANNAPVFDRFVRGMTNSLVPAAQVFSGYAYLGPVYQMASYGDILRLWMTPDFAQPFGLLGLLDRQNGDSSRFNAERWFVSTAVEGGAADLLNRVQNPWSYGVQSALLDFLLLDPAAAPAVDPRPGYPLAFYDAPQGRLVEHTDRTPAARIFDFRCSWISINHQQADGNQFEFYRKGEWLTKEVSNYDNNGLGQTSTYHNTLTLKNACAAGTPTNIEWFETYFWPDGSQWQLGSAAGDPSATISTQAGYTYVSGDTTNLYNRPSVWTPANAALDIRHSSRSVLWLKPDHLVVYDRATSHTAGRFKRWNLSLTAAPVIAGTLTTTTTAGGQHLYVRTLLPATPAITPVPVGAEFSTVAELEPSNNRIVIEDLTTPTDARFLNVLQGADAATPADSATLVQSTAGTPFDGTVVHNSAILFKRDVVAAFTSLTYTVPATTADHYVTGLTPGAGYNVAGSSNAGTTQLVVTPGGARIADNAGVLAFSLAVTPAPPTITGQPVAATVTVGATATLTVTASSGDGSGLTYQWRKDGVNLNPATNPSAATNTLSLPNAQVGDAGSYDCVVADTTGSLTTQAVAVTVQPAAPPVSDTQMINISTRSFVGTDANIQIGGFVIGGSQSKTVLIRASGPALAAFQLTGLLPDPALRLYSGQTVLASNTGWGTGSNAAAIKTTAARVGAFTWPDGSRDSALLLTLQPGAYSAQVSGAAGDTGLALIEVYDADAATANPRLINISTRSFVGTDASIQIGGFVIAGGHPKTVLIRASGPALTAFQLTGVLPDPTLKLYSGQTALASNTAWGSASNATAIKTTAARVGAFAWPDGSRDSALLVTLQPGAYTVLVSGTSGDTGLALVEIYDADLP